MIYEGIPTDLIIFSNERIEHPIGTLGLLSINHLLIVIMSSDFWRNNNRGRICLQQDFEGIKRVVPEDNLDDVFNLGVYKIIKSMGLGTPGTHHNNIPALVGQTC